MIVIRNTRKALLIAVLIVCSILGVIFLSQHKARNQSCLQTDMSDHCLEPGSCASPTDNIVRCNDPRALRFEP